MYEMMDQLASGQRREELLREAGRGLVTGALPADRKRPRNLTLARELKRDAGRLLKPLRRLQQLVARQGTSDGIK
jgi:hypothetical protein